ncbi:unnamed protein product, partial [Sphacelaria rigidula]
AAVESTPSPVVAVEGSNCVEKYGKCGGVGYAGPDCCEDDFECEYKNYWYSQCVQ